MSLKTRGCSALVISMLVTAWVLPHTVCGQSTPTPGARGSSSKSDQPTSPKNGNSQTAAGKAGIEWVRISGGSFMMGSEENSNEKPQHKVRIKAFQMAKTEVTAGQYKKCVQAGACEKPYLDSPGDNHPVVGVNWEQSKKFSEWAGGRLPTEAEWEYAARSGGKEQKYPWGNEAATCERAVIEGFGRCELRPGHSWRRLARP